MKSRTKIEHIIRAYTNTVHALHMPVQYAYSAWTVLPQGDNISLQQLTILKVNPMWTMLFWRLCTLQVNTPSTTLCDVCIILPCAWTNSKMALELNHLIKLIH